MSAFDGTAHDATNMVKLFSPIKDSPPPATQGSGGEWLDYPHGDPPHVHLGVDVATPAGTPCIAPCDGTITLAVTTGFEYGGMVHFRFEHGVGDIPPGAGIGWGHIDKLGPGIGPNTHVKGGQVVAYSNHPAPHVHFIYQKQENPQVMDGNEQDNPTDVYNYLRNNGSGTITPSSGGGGVTGDLGSFTPDDVFAIGRAAAFSTQIELPGLLDLAESIWMKGAKSIYNDEALMPFVEQLCKASLRQFQSLPNGAFFAFYPDQFGLYGHRKPYWNIDNIEIIDGGIDLTDESLATHVFVVGDTNLSGTVDLQEKVASKGVVTIYDAFESDWMIAGRQHKGKLDKVKSHQDAVNFLRKYGVRPHYEEASFIRNGFFEIFYAFTQFQILWANQFRTSFQFTFMPELYPGGIVAFEDHGIQCYIDSVTHSFDYESGFTTQANLSSPAAIGGKDSAISQGMIRRFDDSDLSSTNRPGQ